MFISIRSNVQHVLDIVFLSTTQTIKHSLVHNYKERYM